MMDCEGKFLFIVLLGLFFLSFTNAQSQSCPLITTHDLGSTTEFSANGLVAEAIVPQGESVQSIPVRIMDFTIVCDASGDRINTSSYVSVVVELQCNIASAIPGLTDCDGSTMITRQYQFQCVDQNGEPGWDTIVSGSNQFIQTLNPTATLSTPLASQCRRCIDDFQSARADPITHCDPCLSRCHQGQGRCYLGPQMDECCSFYLQGNCVTDCPSALVADSNFNCACPELTLVNGTVRYSDEGSSVVRNIASVAAHTCKIGFTLLEGPDTVAQQNTRTCSTGGWSNPGFTCERIICPDLTIENGVVGTSPPGRVFMSRTIYTCNDGFALKGDGNRVCQMNSTWDGNDPECVPILPPTPVLVQGLCSVVFWYSPEVPCSEVGGYDVRLYSPQSGQQNVTRRVGANGTFYVIKDEDILAGSGETYVQVRIIHNGREREWSEGISLGCEKPTVSETPRVHFMLAEKVYLNNSVIPLTEVGEGDNALLCKTDKEECCGTVPNRFGEFYYPNGVQVPIANRRQDFYRNGGDQIIRLNRREGITSPTGTYRCEIPNADDMIVTIYVTLTGN